MDSIVSRFNIPEERFGDSELRGMNIWAFESHIWELNEDSNKLHCPWCSKTFDLNSNGEIEVDEICKDNPYVVQISGEIYKEVYSELRKKLKDPAKLDLFMLGFPLIF